MSRSTAGWVGSASSARAFTSRPAAATYCVRSFEPIEKNSAWNRSAAIAAAGTSTMMPTLGRFAGVPAAPSRASSSSSMVRARSSSRGSVTIGSITFTSPCTAARASARS